MRSSPIGHEENTLAQLTAPVWVMFWVVLGCTLGTSLAWSHQKLFWVDELLEYYSDAKPSIHGVILGQLQSPFSLEPPAFHLLLHQMHSWLGRYPEFAARLPSMLALLVTESCSFFITLRVLKNPRAALAAMLGLFFLTTIDYAPEARVYSVFTALFAMSILCYQVAVDPARLERSRLLPFLGLSASLGGAILMHYYGILLILPFVAGESLRTVRKGRLDGTVALALLAAVSLFVLNLPFLRALQEIQAHYYDTGETHWRMIPLTYMWLVGHSGVYWFDLLPFAKLTAHLATILTSLGVMAVIVGTSQWLFARWRTDPEAPVVVVLLAGFLLPIVNVVVAHFFTHAYALRYSLPACVSFSVLTAILCSRFRHRFSVLCLTLLILSLVYTARHIEQAHEERLSFLSSLLPSPQLQNAMKGQEDEHIYIQDTARFLRTYYYAPSSLQSKLVGVRSVERELHWLNLTPSSMFARNMNRTTRVPWVRYEDMAKGGGAHLFVVYHDPVEEWIPLEIASGAVTAEACGAAFGGTLYRVTFRQPTTRGRVGSQGESMMDK